MTYRHTHRWLCLLSAALLLPLTAGPAAASVMNGDFETGDLTDWDSIGIADAVDDAIGVTPAGGEYQALMETNQGGFIGVAQMAAEADDVNDFLSLPAGTLNSLTAEDVTQGAAIRQTVSLEAGEWITFDWNFLTDESLESEFNDFAFVTLVNATTEAIVLADTFDPDLADSPTFYNSETGYESFALPAVASSDDYLLGFGVMDAEDFSISSGLLVDNATVVPEPGSFALLGLVTAAAALRRGGRRRVASAACEA